MQTIEPLLWLAGRLPRLRCLLLLALMLLSSLSEGLGLLMLVPVLTLLQGSAPSGLWAELLQLLGYHAGDTLRVEPLLLLALLLMLLRAFIVHRRDDLTARLQQETVDDLRLATFRALLQVEWRWVSGRRASDHASLLLTDITRAGLGMYFGLGLLATAFAMGAGVLAAFVLSWSMTLIAVVTGSVLVLLMSGQRRAAVRMGDELGQANRALQASVQDSLAGLKLTKILGQENHHLQRLQRTIVQLRERQLRFLRSTSRTRAIYQVLAAVLLIAYVYAGISWLHTPLAQLLILVLIFARLIPMAAHAQQQLHQCLHALPAISDTRRMLQEAEAAAEPAAPPKGRPWQVEQGIELDALSVHWKGRDRPALDRVSVYFPARTTTAIMGPSGSGKSTLADVLMGLLAADGGSLRIDGQTISGELRRSWRRAVACVPQEVFLLHDSIRGNLLWAAPDADDAALEGALRRAAADFVFDLPEGLDTVIGDGGMRLSGGERQRLALARALLQKPALLILDEATSALDVENEMRVRSAIEQLHGDLTVIVIGHRLPTLEHADQVLLLDSGRVKACGNWAAILQQGQPDMNLHEGERSI